VALLAVLAAVSAQAQTVRIVLRWKDVPSARGYELQIARDSEFVDVVLQTRTATPGYRWEQMPTATHWWRVRSFDAEGRPSEWSKPRTVSVDMVVPLPKSPADKAQLTCGEEVTFELEASPLIAEYLVLLSSGGGPARELKSKSPTLSAGRLPPGRWSWKSKGVDLKARVSEEGPSRGFTVRVGAPRPRPVADVTWGAPEVTLGWSEVPCATSYLIEATSDRGERVSIASRQPQHAFKAGQPGDYRWRVAGVGEDGAAGEWSPESVIHVRLPAPVAKPEDLAVPAELAWSPSAGASSYKVELTDGDFTAPRYQASVTATHWRSPELAPATWRWRVTAADALGHTSPPSEPRSFVVRPLVLARAQLLTPAADAALPVGAEVDVAWSQLADANGYEVELDGAVVQRVRSPSMRLSAPPPGLHALRVRGVAKGQCPWSDRREFYVGTPTVTSADIEQRGEEVQVRLLDARGRAVLVVTPSLSVQQGHLSAPALKDGRWVADWSPPPGGHDVLVVSERDFKAVRELHADRDAPFAVGLHAGAIFNGAAVTSPSGVLSVMWRMPWLGQHLTLELRGGLFHAGAALEVGGGQLAASAWLVPVSLLVEWSQRVGDFRLRGGLGPALQIAALRVGPDAAPALAPGLEVLLALARSLGPGSISVEVAYLFGRVDTPLAKLNAGGVSLRLGYVLDVPLGARP